MYIKVFLALSLGCSITSPLVMLPAIFDPTLFRYLGGTFLISAEDVRDNFPVVEGASSALLHILASSGLSLIGVSRFALH